jgi:hypothetical protein
MAQKKSGIVLNQIFVGLPWKNVRQKYDRIILKLEMKYPLHFTIVGRNDGQDAQSLFEIIKQRIATSSYAIFDATGGNANVSLEYGYAEGLGVPRSIFLSAHKAAQRPSSLAPIISDLHGQRRVQYKTEKTLSAELHKLCREHAYTKRFEKALTKALSDTNGGAKKSGRTLAIKIIRVLDGNAKVSKTDLIQKLNSQGYEVAEVQSMLKKLKSAAVIKCAARNASLVHVA